MRTVGTSFQTTTATIQAIPIPSRISLYGIQLTGSLDASAGTGSAMAQVSTSSVLDESTYLTSVLARLNLINWATTNFQANQDSIYVPFIKPFIAANQLYLQVSVNTTTNVLRVACILYFE